MNTLTSLALFGALLGIIGATSTTAVSLGEQILNGSFGTSASAVVTGWTEDESARIRVGDDAVNTATGTSGSS